MLSPHATVAGSVDGQLGTHSQRPSLHRWPLAQRVPVPVQGETVQAFPTGRPQSTALAGGHPTVHTQRRVVASQVSPLGHRVPKPHEGPP